MLYYHDNQSPINITKQTEKETETETRNHLNKKYPFSE